MKVWTLCTDVECDMDSDIVSASAAEITDIMAAYGDIEDLETTPTGRESFCAFLEALEPGEEAAYNGWLVACEEMTEEAFESTPEWEG